MAVASPEENGCFIENPNTGAMMSGAQSRIHFRISTNSHDRALVISSALFQVVDKSHFEMTERPYKRIKCAQSTFFSVFLACIFNEKPCSRARPVSARLPRGEGRFLAAHRTASYEIVFWPSTSRGNFGNLTCHAPGSEILRAKRDITTRIDTALIRRR